MRRCNLNKMLTCGVKRLAVSMRPIADSRQMDMSMNRVTEGEGKIQNANHVRATTMKDGMNMLMRKYPILR